jgi:prepilin-type N-terminal cleavage/methylation domain-containing protein
LKKNGFTLIELAVVVFLLGLMLFLAVPKVRESLISSGVKTVVRHLIGAAQELRNDAIRELVDYELHLDLNGHSFWTCSIDMTPEKRDEKKKNAFRFPDGVRIADVSQIGVEKKVDGEIKVMFFKKGYIQPTVVHLAQDDKYFTLIFSPFSSSLKVYEKYVDVTADGQVKE